MDTAAEERLRQFFGEIGTILEHPRRQASFATYALGLLSDLDRKSVEPIAMLGCPDPERASAAHQSLAHFVGQSDWDDHAVRHAAAKHAMAAMTERAPITTWIIDDTGFLKQGKHSVGVQRQYTGSAGKVANCQVGVSLTVANGMDHLPIDFGLYLPESWAHDPARRKEARIPDDVVFKTKNDIALDLIERAARDGVPGDIVLADVAYGRSSAFRNTVRILGLDYGIGIDPGATVQVRGPGGRWSRDAVAVSDLARKLPAGAFRRIKWREGAGRSLASRFAFRRVRLANDDGLPIEDHEEQWLIVEWEFGSERPGKFMLTTLPASISKKRLVRTLKERYRTEQAYEEMKGELGLDHYEGRRYRGWHHHISVVLCCYAFVVAERARRFFPSADRPRRRYAVPLAA